MAKRKRKPKAATGYGGRELSDLLTFGPQYGPYSGGWTRNRLEQVQVFKHWVFVAIDRIASKLASRIPNVSLVTSEKDPEAQKWVREKALTPLLSHEALKPVRSTHPLLRLIKDPNSPDTSFDLWYETILFLLLTGNAYWYLPRNRVGLPESIWVLPSHWVSPVYGTEGEPFVKAYELRPTDGAYLYRQFPAEDVIHIKKKSPISKVDGYSPTSAIADWVDTQDSVSKAKSRAYENGITPTVAIQFDGTIHDPSPEQLQRIEKKFILRQAGAVNANRPLFLPPGVKIIPLSIQPNQMVFGETGAETRDNILDAFAVPRSNGHKTKDEAIAGMTCFCFYALNPMAEFLGQVVTEKLAWRYDRNLKVWWEHFQPYDPEQIEREIKTDLLAMAITPNEIRNCRGREPLPYGWANKPISPSNMQRQGENGQGGEHDKDSKNKPDKHDLDPDNKRD